LRSQRGFHPIRLWLGEHRVRIAALFAEHIRSPLPGRY
jgi:hypothetical protein